MQATSSKEAEIDRNFAAFTHLLPSLLPEHANQYALMRHGEIVSFHDAAIDAQIAGNRAYGDRVFSIQQVEQQAQELGFYSYALYPR